MISPREFHTDRTYRVDHDRFKHQTRRAESLRDVGKPATAPGRRSSGSSRPGVVPSRCARRDAAVAQDNHPVSNLEHFVEPMRHVDHGDPARAQSGSARTTAPPHPRAAGGGRRAPGFQPRRRAPCDRDKGFLGSAQALDPGIGQCLRPAFPTRRRPRACRGPNQIRPCGREKRG